MKLDEVIVGPEYVVAVPPLSPPPPPQSARNDAEQINIDFVSFIYEVFIYKKIAA
tara:strand:- start:131 stop:295 length:165 start_codon:yes stop_codon:yes gene_type:complete